LVCLTTTLIFMFKKLLIVLIIVLILAAGVFGWWFYFKNSDTGVGSNFSWTDYLPFGNGGDTEIIPSQNNSNNNQTGTTTQNNTTPVIIPQLRKISEGPVAGAVVLTASTSAIARFIDKATGHVFEATLTALQTKRISNTTIPKIAETVWLSSGEGVVLRYVKDDNTIESFFAKLGNTASSTDAGEQLRELGGTFLPINISSLVSLQGKEKIAFMSPASDGKASLFTSLPDGSKKTLVLTTGIHEWNLAWPKEDTFILTTKASNNVLGYSYSVPAKTGTLNKLIGGMPGLSVNPNKDLSYALYSSVKGGVVRLSVLNIKDNTSQELSLKTLAEKCVWSTHKATIIYCGVPKSLANTTLPDDWYQGLVSFSDVLWKVNITTGETSLVADLQTISGSTVTLDATNLLLTTDDSFLVFTNKKDGALWSLRLAK
jgi:hypothetical protein